MTDDEIAALSYKEKSTMLRNDPVFAVRHFDHRLKAFFKDVLVDASVRPRSVPSSTISTGSSFRCVAVLMHTA